MANLDGIYIEIPELTAFREQTDIEYAAKLLEMYGATSPETWCFSLEPVTPENFAETVRQWVSAMSHVSADKISVTVIDGEVHIFYDAGVVETVEIGLEIEL